MKRRLAILAGVLAFAVVLFGALQLPKLLRRTSFFRVHEVEVVGLRYLDRDDVVRRLNLARNASIADPVESVLHAARNIPGVVAASVEKRMPGTLRVTLLEATPVALAAQAERMVLLDQFGKVLPFDPARVPVSLPLAEPDSASAALLTHVMISDVEWFARIERAHRDGSDVLFEEGKHRVRIRAGASASTLRSISAVRGYLERKALPWREIDGRYRDRVFVKKGSA